LKLSFIYKWFYFDDKFDLPNKLFQYFFNCFKNLTKLQSWVDLLNFDINWYIII